MNTFTRAATAFGAAAAIVVPLTFGVNTAEAVISAPSPRSCTYGPSYDTWSQHPTGVTVTFYSVPTWTTTPKLKIYAKAVPYRPDYRNRWVPRAGQIKLGTSWNSVPLDNTYRLVGTVPSGTTFGTSGGWFIDNKEKNADWYSKIC
jgi:hypothetical protein